MGTLGNTIIPCGLLDEPHVGASRQYAQALHHCLVVQHWLDSSLTHYHISTHFFKIPFKTLENHNKSLKFIKTNNIYKTSKLRILQSHIHFEQKICRITSFSLFFIILDPLNQKQLVTRRQSCNLKKTGLIESHLTLKVLMCIFYHFSSNLCKKGQNECFNMNIEKFSKKYYTCIETSVRSGWR